MHAGEGTGVLACWFGDQIFFLSILTEILRVCGQEVPFDKEGFYFGGGRLLRPTWEHSSFSLAGGTHSGHPSPNTVIDGGHDCDLSVLALGSAVPRTDRQGLWPLQVLISLPRIPFLLPAWQGLFTVQGQVKEMSGNMPLGSPVPCSFPGCTSGHCCVFICFPQTRFFGNREGLSRL